MYWVKNGNIAETIRTGYNFQIQKRIVSEETIYGNTVGKLLNQQLKTTPSKYFLHWEIKNGRYIRWNMRIGMTITFWITK